MRRDEFEQVEILLETMFFSVSGMTPRSAGAQKPTPSIHEFWPVSAHRDLSGIFRSVPSRSAAHRVSISLVRACFRYATCYKGL
jgi:hypothetical protein